MVFCLSFDQMHELRLGAETPRAAWHVYDCPPVALGMVQLPEQGPQHRELCEQEKVLKLLEVPLLIQHQRSTVLQFTSLSANLLSSTASYD